GVAVPNDASIGAGVHQLFVDTTLTGLGWHVVPTFNGQDPWVRHGVVTTTKRPSAIDERLASRAHLVATILGLTLMSAWTVSLIAAIRDRWLLAWTALTSITMAALVLADHVDAARW